jgi:molybdopterin molybdotransferase
MLSVAEAQNVILQHARPLSPETMPLAVPALGRVLAEDIVSDVDSPPHDKAMFDGYAIQVADLAGGHATLTVLEEVLAGQVPRRTVAAGQASRIMTGAPIPPGADGVIPRESTRTLPDGSVEIQHPPPRAGHNILRQGSEYRRGQVVLSSGTPLRPIEFGVLATVGRTTARVIPMPRVAIVATGDELVEPGWSPGPGQIRNSNGPMLLAQSARAGGEPIYLGIARDTVDSLRSLITGGLLANILLLAGGVSAGQRDLVPGVLQDARVTAHFHKVELKPGKPLFFGTHEWPDGVKTLVFGLPGNPVSSFVCFELFVRPALRRLAGLADAAQVLQASLLQDFPYRTDRPTYHPALLEVSASGWQVQPVAWGGSADLHGLTRANALVVLPAGERVHRAGELFPVVRLDCGAGL